MTSQPNAETSPAGGFAFRMELVVPGSGVMGDYNNDGILDAADLDLQAEAMMAPYDNKFDENGDGQVNIDDRLVWLHDRKMVYVGDSNLDYEFNANDFVMVFQAGKYETDEAAGWAQGDWNGDLLFNASDFVAAFTEGGYEVGPYPGSPQGVHAVPEPAGIVLWTLGLLLALRNRRRFE